MIIFGDFGGVLFYAVQTNNRVLATILAAVYIAFGLWVTDKINGKASKKKRIANTGWRERSGTKEMPLWERVLKFVFFVAITFFFGWLVFYIETEPWE